VLVGLANLGHLGNTTCGKSAHLYVEFDQTGILAVLLDISGLGPLRNSWVWMVMVDDLRNCDVLIVMINVV